MNTSTFTIIIPCYNAAATLDEAVNSVLDNKCRPRQIILVDDGSKDGTWSLIEALTRREKTIVPIRLKTNRGVSVARNTGLDAADSDFVYFMDADDRLEENCFEKMVPYIEDASIDFVRAKHLLWLASTGDTFPNEGEEKNFNELHRIRPSSFPQVINVYSSWNALYRRSVLEENAIRFDAGLRLGEDRHFNLRFFASANRLTFLNDYTYLWRKDGPADQQATKVLVRDPAFAFKNIDEYSAMADMGWLCTHPRHRVYLCTSMIVELCNALTGYSREYDKGYFPEEAKTAVESVLERFSCEWINFDLPALKGKIDIYRPLYDLAKRYAGPVSKEEFSRSFYRQLGEIRENTRSNIHSEATHSDRLSQVFRNVFMKARRGLSTETKKFEQKIIKDSGLFDSDVYYSTYDDVGSGAVDPLHHYMEIGASELRNPNGWFDTSCYFMQHPDLLVTGSNPLFHYIITRKALTK